MFLSHLPELIIVVVIALVVFGPKRLPELGSSLGSGIREFRKATSELQEGLKRDSAAALPADRAADVAPSVTAAPAHAHEAVYTAAALHDGNVPA